MKKIKELKEKEIREFISIYLTHNKKAIKKFSALKLVKYIDFLKHYKIELPNSCNKTVEHSNEEIINSLFALFLVK